MVDVARRGDDQEIRQYVDEFDRIVEELKEKWDLIDHPHKHLITKEHLDAATAYDIEYPTIVKHGSKILQLEKLARIKELNPQRIVIIMAQ